MTTGAEAGRPERLRGARRLVVFSDLDGTLLDEQYRHDAADATLARLRTAGIPLVLTSSKTRAEMVRMRAELAPGQPVIFENGCGIATPAAAPDAEDEIERFGPDYAGLRATIDAVRTETDADFRGFGDMSDAEVAERTGLPPADAARARTREASEPGVFTGSEAALERFRSALAAHDLRLVRGGRFLHVMPRTDKPTPSGASPRACAPRSRPSPGSPSSPATARTMRTCCAPRITPSSCAAPTAAGWSSTAPNRYSGPRPSARPAGPNASSACSTNSSQHP